MYCRNCGNESESGQKACLSCGFDPTAGERFCGHCGQEVAAGQAVCVKCGHAMAAVAVPGDEPPGKVRAIAIMTLVGGILAVLAGLFWVFNLFLFGMVTFGIGCLLLPIGFYPLVLGVLAIMKGAALLGKDAHLQAAPKTIAIMQIVDIIACDIVNCTLGIISLVFLNDPEVAAYYQGGRAG